VPGVGPYALTINTSTGVTAWSDIGAASSTNQLQEAYVGSFTQPQITLNSSQKGVFIYDAATPIALKLFQIANNAGTTEYLGVDDDGTYVQRLFLFGTAATTQAFIKGDITDNAARGVLDFGLVYTGTAAAISNIISKLTYSGTNAAPLCTTGLMRMIDDTDHSGSGVYSNFDMRFGTDVSTTITQGTKIFYGPRIRHSEGVGSGSHTGGAIHLTGIIIEAFSTYVGVASQQNVGIACFEDIVLGSDKKLILESSFSGGTTGTITKGDTYLSWISASSRLDTYINNTNTNQQTALSHGVIAGTSTTYAKVGGTINVNTTVVGNVGAGEDDLMTYSVPANALATNGDRIEFEMAGTFAANGNNKRVRIKYGATTLLDTTALAFNNADWSAKGQIIRTGAATQKAFCVFRSGSALLNSTSDYTTPAETLSGAVTLKATGEATSNNDITEEMFTVEWHPVN
jgi:hypothetical protein